MSQQNSSQDEKLYQTFIMRPSQEELRWRANKTSSSQSANNSSIEQPRQTVFSPQQTSSPSWTLATNKAPDSSSQQQQQQQQQQEPRSNYILVTTSSPNLESLVQPVFKDRDLSQGSSIRSYRPDQPRAVKRISSLEQSPNQRLSQTAHATANTNSQKSTDSKLSAYWKGYSPLPHGLHVSTDPYDSSTTTSSQRRRRERWERYVDPNYVPSSASPEFSASYSSNHNQPKSSNEFYSANSEASRGTSVRDPFATETEVESDSDTICYSPLEIASWLDNLEPLSQEIYVSDSQMRTEQAERFHRDHPPLPTSQILRGPRHSFGGRETPLLRRPFHSQRAKLEACDFSEDLTGQPNIFRTNTRIASPNSFLNNTHLIVENSPFNQEEEEKQQQRHLRPVNSVSLNRQYAFRMNDPSTPISICELEAVAETSDDDRVAAAAAIGTNWPNSYTQPISLMRYANDEEITRGLIPEDFFTSPDERRHYSQGNTYRFTSYPLERDMPTVPIEPHSNGTQEVYEGYLAAGHASHARRTMLLFDENDNVYRGSQQASPPRNQAQIEERVGANSQLRLSQVEESDSLNRRIVLPTTSNATYDSPPRPPRGVFNKITYYWNGKK